MDFGAHRLGYVASCLSLGIGASHTCRVANATPRRLEELIAANLQELERILLFNAEHGIYVYRIGSSLVPLASHPVNTTRWWRTFRADFERIGAIAARSGQRLSMHPSPAGASLSSRHARVRRAAVLELRYATRVLDLLGQGPDARVVVHVGGAGQGREEARVAAHRFLDGMPDDARRRIAIEHDDVVWSAREVHPLAVEHGLPFVADTLHNRVLPSRPPIAINDLLSMAARSWLRLGLRPKHHLASQRPDGRPGAHADRIDPADWRRAAVAAQDPADFMIEAKDKDLALFALVSLRPAASPGRCSRSGARGGRACRDRAWNR